MFYQGRFDMHNPRCLHDSWVNAIVVDEKGSGDREEYRSIEITMKLLGSYHDGVHVITYQHVKGYSLSASQTHRLAAAVGHGDWLIDELIISSDNLLYHEVHFSEGAHLAVFCEDVSYQWKARGE